MFEEGTNMATNPLARNNHLKLREVLSTCHSGMISAMTKNDVTYPNLEISSPEDIDALNALHNEIDVHYLK